MLVRTLLILVVFCLALAANAALLLRGAQAPSPVTGIVQTELGGTSLHIPRALLRDPSLPETALGKRIELAIGLADWQPLPVATPQDISAEPPDRLSLILTPSGSGAGPAEHFQQVAARFLTSETWSNPGGLILRRFRAGSAYEDREIYIGAGAGKLFIAFCPREVVLPAIEPCAAQIRQDGVDLELRFDRKYLPEWRQLLSRTLEHFAQWQAEPAS